MIKMNQTIKCQQCGNIIQKPISYFNKQKKLGYNKFYCSHQCQLTHMKQQKENKKLNTVYTLVCTRCGKEFTSNDKNRKTCSVKCAHSRVRTEQFKQKLSQKMKGYNNLHPQENHKIKKICPICKKEFQVWESENKTYCSRECYYNDHQHNFRKVGEGGLRKGSGRGKKGWYKGYCCDSSWQLAFVIYNLEHDIKFQRNKEGFEYLINEQKHLYYPDFILEDGTYVQIKGIIDDKNKLKISSFNKPLLILDKEKIKPYLEYVTFKYGKDFIELYEGNPHNLKKNKCIVCGAPCKNICCSRVCIGKYRAQQRWAK